FPKSLSKRRLKGDAGWKAAPRTSAPTSHTPGTAPTRSGTTWPRWGGLWTPRRCPSVREKAMEVDLEKGPQELVWKPYVLNDLEVEASLTEKKGNRLSRDLTDCVSYMAENHGRSGKPSLNLCRRLRWRLSDWFTPARLRRPGPEKLESGRKARRGVWPQTRLAKPHGIQRFFSLSLSFLRKELPPRGSNLSSCGGSGKSQDLLFSECVVCLNTVCT
uniref:Uncharacterized protein n=1 Tax=Rhinolophus ferrumequinum TaxID=59479 RepID=A0A671G6U6_RHIFE